MADPFVNLTASFYTSDAPSLFWEMTICQSLAEEGSPYLAALERPHAYGVLLAGFLSPFLAGKEGLKVAEVGGGQGTLMRRFAGAFPLAALTMVDISPAFSALQREVLEECPFADFVVSDVFNWLDSSDETFDLVILNENLGDLPTIVDLNAKELAVAAAAGPPYAVGPLGRAARLVGSYALELPAEGVVAINAGGLEVVEKLAGRAGLVFLSEHSATVRNPPPYDFLVPLADGGPRAIPLKDHTEYSINFDHLERVARAVGFEVERVAMAEMLGVRHDRGARFMATAECVGDGRAETIHEFLNHVKEYECAVLTWGK